MLWLHYQRCILGSPAMGDQTRARIPAAGDHRASLFSQSYQVALSAGSLIDLLVLLFANPTILRLVMTLQRLV